MAGLAASKQADVKTKAERERSFIDMCKNKDSELEGIGVSAILQHFIPRALKRPLASTVQAIRQEGNTLRAPAGTCGIAGRSSL
jgi:hypothetical protein